MASKLADLVSPFANMLGLSQSEIARKPATGSSSSRSPISPTTGDAVAQVERAAIVQTTEAAVAAERIRWAEIMATGISIGTAAHALHLAKGGMSARDALATLQTAKANTDSLRPPEKPQLTGWLAEKAEQEADPNYKTPEQRREERLQRLYDQGQI